MFGAFQVAWKHEGALTLVTYVYCRVDWDPLLELCELTAEVQDDNGRTILRGLSAKVSSLLCLQTVY